MDYSITAIEDHLIVKSNFGNRTIVVNTNLQSRSANLPVSGYGVPIKRIAEPKSRVKPDDLPEEVVEWLNHITDTQVQQ